MICEVPYKCDTLWSQKFLLSESRKYHVISLHLRVMIEQSNLQKILNDQSIICEVEIILTLLSTQLEKKWKVC